MKINTTLNVSHSAMKRLLKKANCYVFVFDFEKKQLHLGLYFCRFECEDTNEMHVQAISVSQDYLRNLRLFVNDTSGGVDKSCGFSIETYGSAWGRSYQESMSFEITKQTRDLDKPSDDGWRYPVTLKSEDMKECVEVQ